ncbi:hypothetical protein AAFF_G00368090 [Aldrovandia affinis]|uniref:Ig-like domain-containing protein n=1 Tax=Aldrovandia affinis TaxID=143900 RepID=A0AAD7R710_9TELE|nr:hypothetical protein AAFF_G00368090 [Aldrovandia affinis]
MGGTIPVFVHYYEDRNMALILGLASDAGTFPLRSCSHEAKLIAEGNKTAVSGRSSVLSCTYGLPQRVLQILWRKVSGRGNASDVASYAQPGEPVIEEPLRGRVSLSRTLDKTRLHLNPVKTEDEGCYTCEFQCLSEGSKSAVSCLMVYGMGKK